MTSRPYETTVRAIRRIPLCFCVLFLWAGMPACTEDTPCDPDPCVGNSHCVEVDGAEVCECDTGYDGPDCADCAWGYQELQWDWEPECQVRENSRPQESPQVLAAR